MYFMPDLFFINFKKQFFYLVKAVKLLIVSEMIMMNRRGYCLHCNYLV